MNHDVIQKQQYMDLIHTRPRTAATPARCDRMSHPCRELGSPAREMTVSERYGKTENKTTAKGGAPRGGAFPLARGPGAEPRRGLGAEPQARGGVGGVRANAPNRRKADVKIEQGGAGDSPAHEVRANHTAARQRLSAGDSPAQAVGEDIRLGRHETQHHAMCTKMPKV